MKTTRQQLLIATSNRGKYEEYKKLLEPIKSKFDLLSLHDLNIHEAPEETGQSFKENALIKSQYYCKKSGITTIADDSGLSINALSGAPGIYSARWAGAKNDFTKAFNKIFKELREKEINIAENKVTAELNCTISYSAPNTLKENRFFIGTLTGHITKPYSYDNGFGYDPIFIPKNHIQSLSEFTSIEKNKISHRFIATKKLIKALL